MNIAPIRGENGAIGAAAVVVRDISGRKELEGQLREMAMQDPLTGLFNRRHFEAELQRQIALTRRNGQHGALLMMDLDRFKEINDTFGHAAGDEFLRGVAAVLVRRLRSSDVLSRWGGDEFAAILVDTLEPHARAIAIDLEQRIAALRGEEGSSMSASIGVAVIDGNPATGLAGRPARGRPGDVRPQAREGRLGPEAPRPTPAVPSRRMPDGMERQAEMTLGPPSVRAIVRVVLVIVGILAALYLIYLVRSVLGLFLIAVFFALAIAPAVNLLDNRRVPRSLAILLVYVSIAAGIFGIGLLVVPPLVDGVNNLSNDLPGYVDDLRQNKTFREYDNKYDITHKLQQQARPASKLGDAAGTLRDVTVNVFSTLRRSSSRSSSSPSSC